MPKRNPFLEAALTSAVAKHYNAMLDYQNEVAYNQFAQVVPELVNVEGLPKQEQAKEIDLNLLDTVTRIRYTYMPFILGEVAWDYADTCVNLAVLLREQETKKACRNVRNLRKEYEWFRRKSLLPDAIEIEEKKMIELQEIFEDYFGKVYRSFTNHIKAQFPAIKSDKAMLVCSVCMGQSIIAAMRCFERIMKTEVEKKLSCTISRSIIPQHYTDLNTFLLGFLGEENPLGDERFIKEQVEVTKVLVDSIINLQLVLTKDEEDEA